jgi:hypothetical protein
MVNLKENISVEDARNLIKTIKHKNCQTGLKNGHFAPNGYLDDASIFWLYCWGNRGNTVCNQARNVWNDIFDIRYEAFNEDVFYTIAKKRRYK